MKTPFLETSQGCKSLTESYLGDMSVLFGFN